jgi:hypothetical protein
MKSLFLFLCSLLMLSSARGQSAELSPPAKIMTLGVFHFAYPNLDAVNTDEDAKISVLDEPFQSEIKSICNAIMGFAPTVIAVEFTPDQQRMIDSLYLQYKAGKFDLRKNEVYQLAFRIGKQLELDKIYCVDDVGRHYESIESIFNDSARLARFSDYYENARDTVYGLAVRQSKISGIIDELYELNRPEKIKERLAVYLLHPFKYEEEPGDFTGVDFESGRWYNRNLRIFRNIQRIPHSSDDRILLIIGREHLNLLNLFFDVSREFEWVSPLPYLEKARTN